jgi:glutamate formiminotransferase/glutamate formiminotransferase/formiminotetrahydrofolate cyclodeaminase
VLLECVPNFSEGRDDAVIDAIAAAARAPGVALLDIHRDRDHNRSVLTLAGAPAALVEGVFRAVREAVQRIDLSKHAGVHPRIGAADVIPFVPLEGATMELAVETAGRAAERIARELAVPIFFYEEAARRPERRALPGIRNEGSRLGLEKMRELVASDPAWRPDLGPAALHPTAGAACVGARFFLVAFNVDLASEDLEAAKAIAREVRESSGGLPALRAKAFELRSQRRVQVSCNLVDFRKTGLARAFLEIEKKARERGLVVARSELVGLVPQAALEDAGATLLRLEGFQGAERVLERRLAAELPPTPSGELPRYLDAIAAKGHSPGGGSAGALVAALGHACFEKARVLGDKGKLSADELTALAATLVPRARWFELAAEDECAFAELAASWKLEKGDPRKKAAADRSIACALEVARAASALALAAAKLAREGNPNLVNDAALASELGLAAVRGARWNAVSTRRKDAALRAELDSLLDRAEAAVREARSAVG